MTYFLLIIIATEALPGSLDTSKMESFVKIVFSCYLLLETFLQTVLPSLRQVKVSLLNPLSWLKKFGKIISRLVFVFAFLIVVKTSLFWKEQTLTIAISCSERLLENSPI